MVFERADSFWPANGTAGNSHKLAPLVREAWRLQFPIPISREVTPRAWTSWFARGGAMYHDVDIGCVCVCESIGQTYSRSISDRARRFRTVPASCARFGCGVKFDLWRGGVALFGGGARSTV